LKHIRQLKIKRNKNKLNFLNLIFAIIVGLFIGCFLFHISTADAHEVESVKVVFTEETEQIIDEPNIYDIKRKELLRKQKEILNIKDNKEYFLEYKKLIDEYSEWCDPPESIYVCFEEEELDLLFKVVEAEATAGGFNEKANVASVIFNRLDSDFFGDTLNEVLIPSQFSPLRDGRAYKVKITEDTILACEYAFMIDDTTDGAIYFESYNSNVHAAYADYLFRDNLHKFFKMRII
jgi:hypothetical protein